MFTAAKYMPHIYADCMLIMVFVVSIARLHAQTPRDELIQFYQENNPEALESGAVDKLLIRFQGKEARLLQTVREEYAELKKTGIAPQHKWLRGTAWEWVNVRKGTSIRVAFERNGDFTPAQGTECQVKRCYWNADKQMINVFWGNDGRYILTAQDGGRKRLEGESLQNGAGVQVTFVADAKKVEVLQLTAANFDQSMANKNAMMVEFYAPWCGHCKQLAPEYEAANKQLVAEGYVGHFAKVDGSAEQGLLQAFGVNSFPSLLMFKEGHLIDEFNENRVAGTIVDYVKQYVVPPPDFYETLQIARDVDATAVKKAYRALSLTLHPDKAEDGGDPELFNLVQTAYETLSDPDRRAMYDIFGGIKFQSKHLQQTYMQAKRIKLKLYADADGAVGTMNWDGYMSKDPNIVHVVDFYAPWCGHCQELRQEFHKVARTMEGRAKFSAVNCDDEGQLCQQLGIRGYPQVRTFHVSKNMDEIYEGDLLEEPIREWVELMLTANVVELTLQNWETQIVNSPKMWIVDFTAGKWCGPCTSLFSHIRKLSSVVGDGVSVGFVDCDQHRQLCEREQIEAYPAIRFCDSGITSTSGVLCRPMENKWNLRTEALLNIWSDGFAMGVKNCGSGVASGTDDGDVDWSKFEDDENDVDAKGEL